MSSWLQPEPSGWWHTVDEALAEDVGSGDITSACIDRGQLSDWRIEAQGDGVLCGIGIVDFILGPMPGDPEQCWVEAHKTDGEQCKRGDLIIEGRMLAHRVLTSERTALNFLMHLSGIASLTAKFVQKVDGTGAKIVDTRKTLPTLRALQKYAVRVGGGFNHRMGLYDGALIKDNHIAAVGGVREAVERMKGLASHLVRIEVECDSLEQVEEAVAAGADVILLDNMDPFMMREAATRYKGKVLLEASGGVSLDTVRAIAMTGVDLISVGSITHSAPAVSFHLELL